MLFNKKIQDKKEETVTQKGIDIHVMPKKFLRRSKETGNGVNLVIFILIFFAVLGGSAYFFQDYIFPNGIPFLNSINNSNSIVQNNNSLENNNNLNNANANINDNSNINSGLNRNYNKNSNNSNVNTNTNININTNANTNINTNTNTNNLPIIPFSSDRDNDTLTDIEEVIYKTNPNISDTDLDGFLDGQELANLYDPSIGGSAKIGDSNIIKKYINSTYDYSIFYPKGWQVASLGGGDQEITFVSANKEFVEVTVMDNPDGITAVDWYLEQIPVGSKHKAERIWANNFMGIKSLDNMHVYLTPISGKQNFIYSISYMVGSHAYISYPATFQMMIRSFDINQGNNNL